MKLPSQILAVPVRATATLALTMFITGCATVQEPASAPGTIDASTFTTFFAQQASKLDGLTYTATYTVDGTTVTVQRTPEQLSSTFSRPGGDVVLRLTADAATLCRPAEASSCTGVDAWLDDPVANQPPPFAGHDAGYWWDLFTATGAHDPSTVAFIPQVTTAEPGRDYFLSTKDLAGVGVVECAGYRRSRSTGSAITWCFTAEGVWASGPTDRSILIDVDTSR